jgi:outer membrane lipoprotein-sorting protein
VQAPPPKPIVLPSDVKTALNKMESAMKNLKSVQFTSNLTLTYRGKKLSKTEKSSADVYMQKPLLFRVDAQQDGQRTILFVCDGYQLYYYNYQTNRYSSFEPTPERIEKATGFSLLSFVLTPNLQQKLLVGIVSASLEKTPPNSSYSLVSLKGKNDENILIYIDKKTSLPLKTQIITQYATMEEIVSNLKLNSVIPPSTFQFKPPKGALRVDFRL